MIFNDFCLIAGGWFFSINFLAIWLLLWLALGKATLTSYFTQSDEWLAPKIVCKI